MKTRQFEVPAEIMFDFAKLLTDNEVDNWMDGTNDEDEIIVIVQFEKSKKSVIEDLYEMIDDYHEENEKNEEDDDEKEED